jgi:hypothetical protein
MNDIPSIFVGGYVHAAKLPCPSCRGMGMIDGFPCAICIVDGIGSGAYTVKCGGVVTIDMNHPGLGAECLSCGKQVPIEQVTRVG